MAHRCHKGLQQNLPPIPRIKPSSAHRCSPPSVLSFTPLSPPSKHCTCPPVGDIYAHTVTPNTALLLTSMTVPSGTVQTEKKGHFLSILDISGWDTLREVLSHLSINCHAWSQGEAWEEYFPNFHQHLPSNHQK